MSGSFYFRSPEYLGILPERFMVSKRVKDPPISHLECYRPVLFIIIHSVFEKMLWVCKSVTARKNGRVL